MAKANGWHSRDLGASWEAPDLEPSPLRDHYWWWSWCIHPGGMHKWKQRHHWVPSLLLIRRHLMPQQKASSTRQDWPAAVSWCTMHDLHAANSSRGGGDEMLWQFN